MLKNTLIFILTLALGSAFWGCDKKKGGGGGGDSKSTADDCTTDDTAETAAAEETVTTESPDPTALALQDEDAAVEEDAVIDDDTELETDVPSDEETASNPCDTTSTTDTSSGDTTPPLPKPLEFKEGFGCVQGMVLNGYTGTPVDLAAEGQNLYVLIRGKKLVAATLDDPNLKGQYYICGIPLDETYSIFGFIAGMHAFESTVNIKSTVANLSGDLGAATSDIKKKDPLIISNIVVFPVATGDRALTVKVFNEGQPVEGALVDIEPTPGGGHFATTSSGAAFTYTNGSRNFALRATTDAKGIATFAAATVTLGQPYNLNVTPPAGKDLSSSNGTFTFGISGPALSTDNDNYTYNVELSGTDVGLKIVSCSVQYESWNDKGRVTAVFNRDIALVGANGWTLTLAGPPGGDATLVADDDSNNVSEQVTAVLAEGTKNTILMTPKFDTNPTKPDYTKDKSQPANVDVDRTVKFNGVKVDVLGDATQNNIDISTVDTNDLCGVGAAKFRTRMFKEHPGP
jgi:hypothetical protein